MLISKPPERSSRRWAATCKLPGSPNVISQNRLQQTVAFPTGPWVKRLGGTIYLSAMFLSFWYDVCWSTIHAAWGETRLTATTDEAWGPDWRAWQVGRL